MASRARQLSKLLSSDLLTVDVNNSRIGVNSTSPEETLDVRDSLTVGNDILSVGITSVGIGTDNSNAKLRVQGNADNLTGQFRQGANTVIERTIIAQSTNGMNFGAFVDDSHVRHLVTGQNDVLTTDNNFVSLHTNSGTERMRITSGGSVGIGTTNPAGKLHIQNADSGGSVGASADELVIENSDYAGITLLSNTQGLINFADSADVNVGNITYDHASNFMNFKVNDVERLRIHSDGHGEFYSGAITRVVVADDATPSGTSQSYTSIPSWATKITVIFDRISTNGAAEILVQLGTSGGVISSNYESSSQNEAGTTTETSTEGFVIFHSNASHTLKGSMVIEKVGTSSKWVENHLVSLATGPTRKGNGVLTTYSGTIDRVTITTEGGSNTFDGGTFTVYAEA